MMITATVEVDNGVVGASNVEAEEISWIWPGRFPKGMITMIDGDPGLGKSMLSIDFAAHLSTGKLWPDGQNCPVGNTLLISYEDSPAHIIKPRLIAAGADMSKVFLLTHVPDGDGGHIATLPDDVDFLEKIIVQYDIDFIIIDPILAAISGEYDSWKSQQIRAAFNSLVKVIEHHGVSVILIRHLNKQQGAGALYRGEGSVALIALSRAGFIVVRDPSFESESLLFLPLKFNIGRKPQGLKFDIAEDERHRPYIVWSSDRPKVTADEVLNPTRSKKASCAVWLEDYLEKYGETPSIEVEQIANDQGFSERTLRRAREDLGIKPVQKDSKWFYPKPDRPSI
jgi:putative DNA primase/helicase